MGNNQVKKINFEDLNYSQNDAVVISTLPTHKQECLIYKTVPYYDEENIINQLVKNNNMSKIIIVYGENANDISIYNKYKQLISLGFCNVYLYCGGLFEWLLLQDIYGKENFKTTSEELDILKFKPAKVFGTVSLLN